MPGYEGGKHMQELFEYDILARTGDADVTSVTIATSARDDGHSDPTKLRAGLVLGEIQDGGNDDGKYKEFDSTASDGSQLSSDVMILMHEVHDIDVEERLATALRQGVVKEQKIYNGANVDWSKCQRITLSDKELD